MPLRAQPRRGPGEVRRLVAELVGGHEEDAHAGQAIAGAVGPDRAVQVLVIR